MKADENVIHFFFQGQLFEGRITDVSLKKDSVTSFIKFKIYGLALPADRFKSDVTEKTNQIEEKKALSPPVFDRKMEVS